MAQPEVTKKVDEMLAAAAELDRDFMTVVEDGNESRPTADEINKKLADADAERAAMVAEAEKVAAAKLAAETSTNKRKKSAERERSPQQ